MRSEIEFLQELLTDEYYVACKAHRFSEQDNFQTIGIFAQQFYSINKMVIDRLIELNKGRKNEK